MLFVCSVLRMLFPWLKLARHPGLKTCVYTRDQMNPCAALAVEKAFCSKAGSCKATEGVGALNSAVPKVRTRAEGAWLRRTGLCLGLSWLEAAPCSPLCLCVCSSLLREHSIDGTGWAPTRTLKVECNALDHKPSLEASPTCHQPPLRTGASWLSHPRVASSPSSRHPPACLGPLGQACTPVTSSVLIPAPQLLGEGGAHCHTAALRGC